MQRAGAGRVMRNTFSEALYKAATKNPKIYIVVADISPAGSMAKFSAEYPERFINVGVAEQSMIGICAGLALKGCQPFAYTIATFSLYRPFEMVRDDLCYQNLPVTVVGMGAGVIYSTLGGTHHTQEDIAIAGAMPNMQIIAPCDPHECTDATRWCAQQKQRARSTCASARPASRATPQGRRPVGVRQDALPRAAAPTCASSPTASSRRWRSRSPTRSQAQGKSVSLVSVPHPEAARPRRHHRCAAAPQARHRHRGARAAGRPRAADQADRLGHAAPAAASIRSRCRMPSSTTTAPGTTCSPRTACRRRASSPPSPER